METFGINFEKKFELGNSPIKYEYQAVVTECEEYFGKNKVLWTLPFKKNCTEQLLRYALKETKKKEIKDIRYFLKIVSNKSK